MLAPAVRWLQPLCADVLLRVLPILPLQCAALQAAVWQLQQDKLALQQQLAHLDAKVGCCTHAAACCASARVAARGGACCSAGSTCTTPHLPRPLSRP